jgi:hypothetical protein
MIAAAVEREVLPIMRELSERFRSFGESFADAAAAVDSAGRAFQVLAWQILTPAQRRRHGKRLVREAIAARRIQA